MHFSEFVNLNLRKTSATHSRCTFSSCRTPNNQLKTISRIMRFDAIKSKKIYIPAGARACSFHYTPTNWNITNEGDEKFSKNQIEEIIELLCKTELPLQSPGMLR